MLRSHRSGTKRQSKRIRRDDGVIEPDARVVFAVVAIGMLVGALLTTPSKQPAKLESPMPPIAASQ